jgi:autotransporter-associated beta strand protein
VSLNAGNLTLQGNNSLTLTGVISGAGGLIINNSASIVTLNGINTYTGGTLISSGGLLLGNNAALGTGALTVTGNATLDGTAALSLANNTPQASTAPRSAPTIASRRLRLRVLRWPAAAPLSASMDRAAAIPTCSRRARLSGMMRGRSTSRRHWPMAGRTSPPTAR